MAKFQIEGPTPLRGNIKVAGNKNAALPIIAAAALTNEECVIHNSPKIRDVEAMLSLLSQLGKEITYESDSKIIISGEINSSSLNEESAGKLRASILFASPLLSKFGETKFPPPGGCVIGRRRLDSNLDVFSALGASEWFDGNEYSLKLTKEPLKRIFLKEASVTATENALLLAANMEEEITIVNTAGEPHISDLSEVLRKMGASIAGDGTNKIIIRGKKELKGFEHTIAPDYIETGTFAIAAAATKGDLIIHDAVYDHIEMTLYHLKKMGVKFEFENNKLHVFPSELSCGNHKIQVGLWPGFPTDLMSPMIVLATQCKGVTLCHDWMFESRMFFVDKLIVMGGEITQCDPHRVLVNGSTMLRGQSLSSPDIRAGIALVIAAMSAQGVSKIDHVELIDRGYVAIDERLNSIGASITRIEN